MTDSSDASWPGPVGTAFRLIDWAWTADQIVAFVNEPDLPVAVTVLWGAKIALANASLAATEHAAVAGDVLPPLEGPLRVAARGGTVTFSRYAIEAEPQRWLYHDQLPHFLSLFDDLARSRDLRFSTERFESFQNVLDHCVIRYGYTRREAATQGHPVRPPTRDGYMRAVALDCAVQEPWVRMLFARCGLGAGDRVLDVGAGSLWLPRLAHECGLEGWGSDIHPAADYETLRDWLHYFQADLGSFPRLPAKFDLICVRGLTPLIYARDLNAPALLRFRDTLLDGLSEKGAIYVMQQGLNTGIARSANDWGNFTIEQLHDWLGRFFPHVQYSRSAYTGIVASRRPIAEPWREARTGGLMVRELGEEMLAELWSHYERWRMSPADYGMLLLKISQRFWERDVVRTGGPVFVLGASTMAADLAHVISTLQPSLELKGYGEALPDGLPPATFIYRLPDAPPDVVRRFESCTIGWSELLGRLLTGDLFSTAGDHDLDRVKRMQKRVVENLERRLKGAEQRVTEARKTSRIVAEAAKAGGAGNAAPAENAKPRNATS